MQLRASSRLLIPQHGSSWAPDRYFAAMKMKVWFEMYSVPSAKSPEVLPTGSVSSNHSSLRPRLDRLSTAFSGGSRFTGAGGLHPPPTLGRLESSPYRDDGFHLGAGFHLLPILKGGNRLCDVLLRFLQFAERQCLEIVINHWAVPGPGCSGIDSPSWQGPAFPSREGQGGESR